MSSRRALLAGAVATMAGLAGCDLAAGNAATWHPAPDPLVPLLARTLALRDRYAEVLAAFPALQDRLGPLKDNHAAHAVALAREIGLDETNPFPSGTPSVAASTSAPPAGDQAAAVAALTALEKTAQEDATGACLAAPSYRAALLGSIAACRAGHQEALK